MPEGPPHAPRRPADAPDAGGSDELDRLMRESVRRSQELREIATRLPAAVSRRSVLRQMVAGVVRAPDRGRLAARVAHRAVRIPVDVGKVAFRGLVGR